MLVRESPGELKLRAEEVALRSRVSMSITLQRSDGGPPLVDADWHAFCQAIYKGIEGEDWAGLYDWYREMSRAAGVKKRREAQKSESPLENGAAKDRREDFYDPDRKDNILGRIKTRLELWEELLKDRARAPMASVGFLQSLWEKPIWEGVWPYLDPMDGACFRTASWNGMCQGSVGRMASSSSS